MKKSKEEEEEFYLLRACQLRFFSPLVRYRHLLKEKDDATLCAVCRSSYFGTFHA